MAINQVVAPDTAPQTLADWTKVNNIFQVVALMILGSVKLQSGVLKKGSAVCHGGTWYVCNTDTTPSGTASEYIKLVKSGDGLTLTASFVADLTGVTFSTTWNHWVNENGDYIIFDELRAYGAGLIPYPSTIINWKPRGNVSTKLLSNTDSETNGTTFGFGSNRTNQLEAFTGDDFIGGGYYIKAIRTPESLNTRLVNCTKDSGSLGNAVFVANADNAYSWQGVNASIGSDGTYGEIYIGEYGNWSIPAGLYMMTGQTSELVLEIYNGLSYGGSSPVSGLILSDGTNFLVQNTGSNGRTLIYRKLA